MIKLLLIILGFIVALFATCFILNVLAWGFIAPFVPAMRKGHEQFKQAHRDLRYNPEDNNESK